jgi:hypothetical protein
MIDHGLVALHGTTLRFLIAPAKIVQDAADLRRMIVHLQFPLDYRRNPTGRPQVVRVAVVLRSHGQELRQPLPRLRAQFRRSARCWLGRQSIRTCAAEGLAPLPHSADRRSHHPCHHHQRLAALKKLHRSPPTPLQLCRTPLWSHAGIVACLKKCSYYLCNAQ